MSRFFLPPIGALAGLALGLLVQSAAAFPPSAEDRRRFTATILQATKELTLSARPDLAKARRNCGDARDMMRRFDANDYWIALVEDCFAAISEIEQDRPAACGHYRLAAEKYAKVRSDPKARSVEADLARVEKAQTRLGCITPVVAKPIEEGSAGPLTEASLQEIIARTTGAQRQLTVAKNPDAARDVCEEARLLARRFSANGYASGLVEECFGDVETFEKNPGVACTRYGLALTHFAAAKRGEIGYAAAAAEARKVRRVRGRLKC